jgi:UDP-N-acetylmuramyl pentapeptide phosphotransferase/UDP-N-acetylglucosamine-1-phosphate transferase
MTLLLVAGGAVTAISFVGVRLVLAVARRKDLLDHPNERSSHSIPTPSGGGVGLAGAIALVLPVAAVLAGVPQLFWLLPTVVVACGLGIYDDARPLGAGAKLIALALASAPVFGIAAADLIRLPYLPTFSLAWAGVPLTVFWLTGYANAFNFMDGIDGIAGITAAVSGAVFAVAGALAGDLATTLTGTLVLGASLGFLPANFPRARIFMGDAGSLPLGILLAAAALLAADDHGVREAQALSFPASVLLLGPFLFDVVFTLTRRAARGARLGEAHREHLYQRLARQWGGHPRVSLLYGGFALATGALALAYDHVGELGKLVCLSLPLLTMCIFAAAVLRTDRSTVQSRLPD